MIIIQDFNGEAIRNIKNINLETMSMKDYGSWPKLKLNG
jgi:hypothetical protein